MKCYLDTWNCQFVFCQISRAPKKLSNSRKRGKVKTCSTLDFRPRLHFTWMEWYVACQKSPFFRPPVERWLLCQKSVTHRSKPWSHPTLAFSDNCCHGRASTFTISYIQYTVSRINHFSDIHWLICQTSKVKIELRCWYHSEFFL